VKVEIELKMHSLRERRFLCFASLLSRTIGATLEASKVLNRPLKRVNHDINRGINFIPF